MEMENTISLLDESENENESDQSSEQSIQFKHKEGSPCVLLFSFRFDFFQKCLSKRWIRMACCYIDYRLWWNNWIKQYQLSTSTRQINC